MKKGSKLFSVLNLKCPRCQEGKLFEHPTFAFKKSFKMLERCPNCNQNYEPEPGFYFGAMFISYIFMAFFSLTFIFLLIYIGELSVNASFFWLILISTIFFVSIFRLSRAIWLNLNVKFDDNYL